MEFRVNTKYALDLNRNLELISKEHARTNGQWL